MQSNIFELIDLLVKMSGSGSNIDELKADLDDTDLAIDETQEELRKLEGEMNDDKYFDASNEIVDRNIKISLTKKIQKLTKIKNDIDSELAAIIEEENRLHIDLENINEEIRNASSYSDVINDIDSKSEAYADMVAIESTRINKLNETKADLENRYEKVQKKVEYLAQSSNEMEDKIAKENERLIEIENSLSNIKSYVDTDAKEEDEQRYLDIKNYLDDLFWHKSEILEDPVYIAAAIKEHIANENKDEVETEFNHLVDKVKEIPYMDLENDDIPVEMQKLNDELTSFDNEISQKVYQTLDAEFIDERITYLEDYIKKTKDRIKELKNRQKLLNDENDLLSAKIYRAETQLEAIDDSLVDYENYDLSENEIPRTVIQAAYNKLIEEKGNIYVIAERYRQDMVLNIGELKDIEELIGLYEEEAKAKDEEYDELSKKLSLNTTSKNILEEEKDKLALEKINNKIVDLKYREQFNKSLSSILEEFEMLYSSLEFVDKKTRMSRRSKKKEEEITPISEIEDIKLVPEKGEEEVKPVIEEEDTSIKPIEEVKEEEKKEDKLRVVEIIPLTEDVSEKEEENNFMISDFQDDDYVDIKEAMEHMEEN